MRRAPHKNARVAIAAPEMWATLMPLDNAEYSRMGQALMCRVEQHG